MVKCNNTSVIDYVTKYVFIMVKLGLSLLLRNLQYYDVRKYEQ